MSAVEKLLDSMRLKNSLVCCGLDPDLSKFPFEILNSSASNQVLGFLCTVVDITIPHVCAYKIQKAFFDIFDDGHSILCEIVNYIRKVDPSIYISLDCKIGDIDNTMKVYLANMFDIIGVDGVVINPYMGQEVFEPFLKDYSQKSGIVLVKTSNPGASKIQDLKLWNNQLLWEEILFKMVSEWNGASNLIPVLASTHLIGTNGIRSVIPDQMPILYAGFGAQGGSLVEFSSLLNSEQSGVFVNSSRGLLYPYNSEDTNWRESILSAVTAMKQQLNQVRGV